MSSGWLYLLTTLLVYTGTSMISCWGLDLQIGMTNVLSFGYILFVSIGAYVAAVLTLGPDSANGGFQQYILGLHLPFPLPWLAAMAAGGLLGLAMGVLSIRRLRGDYEAVVMLVLALVAFYFVNEDARLFNGSPGVSLIPSPFAGFFRDGAEAMSYRWLYVGIVAVGCVLTYLLVRAIMNAPLGRALRAVRENDAVAAALGKNVVKLRILVLVVGGALGGLAGGMLGQFITAWSPGAWTYPETFTLFAAIIVGGRANAAGVALGAVLVPGVIGEGVIFLPAFNPSYLTPALQWILIGLLIILFMWFRPQGLLPERRRRFAPRRAAVAVAGAEVESLEVVEP